MKHETVHYTCDVTNCGSSKNVHPENLQVIFCTEQTEGKSVRPYLSNNHKLDLCDDCRAKIYDGNYLFGSGAMGNNSYWFKSDVK